MKIARRYTTKARIEMIPLIDVIFLLLVTFIFFSMSMTIYKRMEVSLPSASTAMVDRKNVIGITVKNDGSIYVEREKVVIADLYDQFLIVRNARPEAKVLISGDRGASYEMIIAVMDAVKKAGIEGVSLETEWK